MFYGTWDIIMKVVFIVCVYIGFLMAQTVITQSFSIIIAPVGSLILFELAVGVIFAIIVTSAMTMYYRQICIGILLFGLFVYSGIILILSLWFLTEARSGFHNIGRNLWPGEKAQEDVPPKL